MLHAGSELSTRGNEPEGSRLCRHTYTPVHAKALTTMYAKAVPFITGMKANSM